MFVFFGGSPYLETNPPNTTSLGFELLSGPCLRRLIQMCHGQNSASLADWVMVPEGGAASKGTSLLTIRECPKAGAQKPGPTGTGQSWVATFWSNKAFCVWTSLGVNSNSSW